MRIKSIEKLAVSTVIFSLATLFSMAPTVGQDLPAGAEPGRVEQRFEERPPADVAPRVVRGLESTTPPAEAAAFTLSIKSVTVAGSTVYDQSELTGLYNNLIGSTVTLAQVFDIAAAITAKYGQDGYILSRAIVPPQELEPAGANIRIEIIEGYIDEVRWPDFTASYRDLFSAYAKKITTDRPLNVRTLERYLLLANDLPGLSFESNLIASETTPGASALIVTGTEDHFSGYVTGNNYGVEASGPYQGTLGVTLSNLLRQHGQLQMSATFAGPSESDRQELAYLDWRYSQILWDEGLTFFVDGNASWGDPGSAALLAFDTKTQGLNLSTGILYPFIRSRSQNLTGTIAFDFKNAESSNLGIAATEDRLRIVRGELAYDFADERGGVNRLVGTASLGIEGLGSTKNGNPLASRTPGIVDFFKVTGEISRTQKLANRWSLYGSIFGQWSDDPLLSSQECGYGGRQYGRGFDASIITGDQCILTSLELRHDLRLPDSASGYLTYAQPYAFADYGQIWNIAAPLGTPTRDDGASAGLGIRFGNERLSADLSATRVIMKPDSQPGVSETSGWFKVTLRF